MTGRVGDRIVGARRAVPLLVFVLALAVYLSTGQKNGSGDAIPSSLIPVSLLLHGTTRLDEFTPALQEQWDHKLPYFLRQTAHGVVSLYPVATGLLATPILALPILAIARTFSPTPDEWLVHARKLQFYAAAIITAATAVLFWLVCANLGFGFWLGLGLTTFYAFGSQAFCTSSQTLWQHGPGVLFILATLLCVARLQSASPKGGALTAVVLSLAAASAVAVRPTELLLVGPFMLLAFWRQPRLAPALLLPGCLIGAALLAYNLYFFDALLGGYDSTKESLRWSLDHFRAGLAGLLFSPGRGLFLYFPFAAVALLMILTRPALLREGASAALAISIVSSTALFSVYSAWEGGWSVGPRYLTESQPLILILAGITWPSFSAAAQRRLAILCFGILLPYSIFIQSVGSYSAGPLMWNRDYYADYPRALWYLRDNPIARGLR